MMLNPPAIAATKKCRCNIGLIAASTLLVFSAVFLTFALLLPLFALLTVDYIQTYNVSSLGILQFCNGHIGCAYIHWNDCSFPFDPIYLKYTITRCETFNIFRVSFFIALAAIWYAAIISVMQVVAVARSYKVRYFQTVVMTFASFGQIASIASLILFGDAVAGLPSNVSIEAGLSLIFTIVSTVLVTFALGIYFVGCTTTEPSSESDIYRLHNVASYNSTSVSDFSFNSS